MKILKQQISILVEFWRKGGPLAESVTGKQLSLTFSHQVTPQEGRSEVGEGKVAVSTLPPTSSRQEDGRPQLAPSFSRFLDLKTPHNRTSSKFGTVPHSLFVGTRMSFRKIFLGGFDAVVR